MIWPSLRGKKIEKIEKVSKSKVKHAIDSRLSITESEHISVFENVTFVVWRKQDFVWVLIGLVCFFPFFPLQP